MIVRVSRQGLRLEFSCQSYFSLGARGDLLLLMIDQGFGPEASCSLMLVIRHYKSQNSKFNTS